MKDPIYFGNVEVGFVPKVVAVIAGEPDEFVPLTQRAQGADVLELRADYCEGDADAALGLVAKIRAVSKCPILLTIRRLTEGGYFFQDEAHRLSLFQKLIPRVDAVDVELYAMEIRDDVIKSAYKHHKPVVVSYHNFLRTPSRSKLEEVADDAVQAGANMLKIAVMAQSTADVRALQAFTTEFSRDILLTTISMGDMGAVSRILNPFLGSCFTYGFVGEPTVPGQIHIQDLRRLIDLFPGERIDLAQAQELLPAALSASESHLVTA